MKRVVVVDVVTVVVATREGKVNTDMTIAVVVSSRRVRLFRLTDMSVAPEILKGSSN